MKPPETTSDWQKAGYTYLDDGVCRGAQCGMKIEWWETPKGKKLALSTKISGTLAEGNRREILVAHWTDCPNAGDFRTHKKGG